MIDRSREGVSGIPTNIVETPSINDQLHSEDEESMYWGRHDCPSVSSPDPSNSQWFDWDLLEVLQLIRPEKVLRYLSNTELLQGLSPVSRLARHISESHLLNEIMPETYITLATKVNSLAFEETEWEHCYPPEKGKRLLHGDRIVFKPKIDPNDLQSRQRRLHRPGKPHGENTGEFSPCTIAFHPPFEPKAYHWHLNPVEHERARNISPSSDSQQSARTKSLIVFHNFSSSRFRGNHAKIYYKVEGEGPDVTLHGVSIRLSRLIGMMLELESTSAVVNAKPSNIKRGNSQNRKLF